MKKIRSKILLAFSCIGACNASDSSMCNIDDQMGFSTDRVKQNAQDLYDNIQNFVNNNMPANVIDEIMAYHCPYTTTKTVIKGEQLGKLYHFIGRVTKEDISKELTKIIPNELKEHLANQEDSIDIFQFIDQEQINNFFFHTYDKRIYAYSPMMSQLINLITIVEHNASALGNAYIHLVKHNIIQNIVGTFTPDTIKGKLWYEIAWSEQQIEQVIKTFEPLVEFAQSY